MNVFTVTKEGVYRHDILGIYSNLSVAMEMAMREASKEKEDGYHCYHVSQAEIGIPCDDVVFMYSYQKKKDYDRSTRPYTFLKTYVEICNQKREVINQVELEN